MNFSSGEIRYSCGVPDFQISFPFDGHSLNVAVVTQNKGFEYGGNLIYAMALYTFYTTIVSIINVVKYRRDNSPVLSAAKAVNLTAALVSILSLETAMLSQFGSDDEPTLRRTMTAVTGFLRMRLNSFS